MSNRVNYYSRQEDEETKLEWGEYTVIAGPPGSKIVIVTLGAQAIEHKNLRYQVENTQDPGRSFSSFAEAAAEDPNFAYTALQRACQEGLQDTVLPYTPPGWRVEVSVSTEVQKRRLKKLPFLMPLYRRYMTQSRFINTIRFTAVVQPGESENTYYGDDDDYPDDIVAIK